jgi:hypothetical protein
MPAPAHKALLVGIDHYSQAPLQGCVNDAFELSELLSRHDDGTLNFDCLTVLSDDGTDIGADDIQSSVDELLRNPDELVLFHFSGHGTKDAHGSHLVAQDGTLFRLTDLLSSVNKSPAKQVVVLLDCCFAGGLGAADFLNHDLALLKEGRAFLVASRSDETAAEDDDGGVFSTLLAGGLEGGAADVLGDVTVAGLYAYLDEALGPWEQRPLLKANLSTLAALRRCDPLVPLDTLRMLPALFPTSDTEFTLDPSYEPDEDYPPVNKEHEAIFKRLQDCNRARLIDPIGEDHMFYAAIHSTGCRLTAMGKRYWRMAKDGKI